MLGHYAAAVATFLICCSSDDLTQQLRSAAERVVEIVDEQLTDARFLQRMVPIECNELTADTLQLWQ